MKRKISVSFFSSKNVIDDLLDIEVTNADYIHVDVGDGKFIKKKFHPYKTLDKLLYVMRKRLDVHLMVEKPEKYINQYSLLNTECIYLHVELGDKLNKCFEQIKTYGIKCGLAISPDTDINLLKDYLDIIDVILVMSVIPGAGGQSFIEETTNRIDSIKKLIGKRKILINVDGGINNETISKVSCANIVVSGSYILSGDDLQEKIDSLR